jgi:uncharacterized protein YndB with AHSA1/START domain
MAEMKKTKLTADPGRRDLTLIREFDAPRELVFKAYTDPKLYVQWLGPENSSTRLEKFEPWSGGTWRYTTTDNEGKTYRFHGVNHEVTAPERIIDTFEWDDLPEKGHVSLEKAEFETLPGNRTKVTSHTVYFSPQDRDAMMQGGMEQGIEKMFEKFDTLLEQMKTTAVQP